MLKCRDVARQASDYMEYNQGLLQRLNVALHLLMCGKCRLFIRHLRTSLQYYRNLPEQELEDAAAASIAEQVISNAHRASE